MQAFGEDDWKPVDQGRLPQLEEKLMCTAGVSSLSNGTKVSAQSSATFDTSLESIKQALATKPEAY